MAIGLNVPNPPPPYIVILDQEGKFICRGLATNWSWQERFDDRMMEVEIRLLLSYEDMDVKNLGDLFGQEPSDEDSLPNFDRIIIL